MPDEVLTQSSFHDALPATYIHTPLESSKHEYGGPASEMIHSLGTRFVGKPLVAQWCQQQHEQASPFGMPQVDGLRQCYVHERTEITTESTAELGTALHKRPLNSTTSYVHSQTADVNSKQFVNGSSSSTFNECSQHYGCAFPVPLTTEMSTPQFPGECIQPLKRPCLRPNEATFQNEKLHATSPQQDEAAQLHASATMHHPSAPHAHADSSLQNQQCHMLGTSANLVASTAPQHPQHYRHQHGRLQPCQHHSGAQGAPHASLTATGLQRSPADNDACYASPALRPMVHGQLQEAANQEPRLSASQQPAVPTEQMLKLRQHQLVLQQYQEWLLLRDQTPPPSTSSVVMHPWQRLQATDVPHAAAHCRYTPGHHMHIPGSAATVQQQHQPSYYHGSGQQLPQQWQCYGCLDSQQPQSVSATEGLTSGPRFPAGKCPMTPYNVKQLPHHNLQWYQLTQQQLRQLRQHDQQQEHNTYQQYLQQQQQQQKQQPLDSSTDVVSAESHPLGPQALELGQQRPCEEVCQPDLQQQQQQQQLPHNYPNHPNHHAGQHLFAVSAGQPSQVEKEQAPTLHHALLHDHIKASGAPLSSNQQQPQEAPPQPCKEQGSQQQQQRQRCQRQRQQQRPHQQPKLKQMLIQEHQQRPGQHQQPQLLQHQQHQRCDLFPPFPLGKVRPQSCSWLETVLYSPSQEDQQQQQQQQQSPLLQARGPKKQAKGHAKQQPLFPPLPIEKLQPQSCSWLPTVLSGTWQGHQRHAQGQQQQQQPPPRQKVLSSPCGSSIAEGMQQAAAEGPVPVAERFLATSSSKCQPTPKQEHSPAPLTSQASQPQGSPHQGLQPHRQPQPSGLHGLPLSAPESPLPVAKPEPLEPDPGCARGLPLKSLKLGCHPQKPCPLLACRAAQQRKQRLQAVCAWPPAPSAAPAVATKGRGRESKAALSTHAAYKMARAQMSRFVVRRSAIAQHGVYTREDIPQGELLMEYVGQVVRRTLADLLEKHYESAGLGDYFFSLNEDHVVDATQAGNMARFINHSCNPNCEAKFAVVEGQRRVFIYAIRDLQAGEELTYDYKMACGLLLDPSQPLVHEVLEEKARQAGITLLRCSCGAPNCKRFL